MTAYVQPEVFVSYRRSQSARVRPAVEALRAAGVRCFFDQDDIDPLADFPQRLRGAIDASLALLAWWSEDFNVSDHCLAEFRRAWQHARRQSALVHERLWVLNPLPTVAHISAGDVDAQNFLPAPIPGQEADWARALVRDHLAPRLEALRRRGPLAQENGAAAPHWLHGVPQPSRHFTGRNAELMAIHSRLHRPLLGAQAMGIAVQTHGLAGIGKTELATAYASDFAHAYPGGVFWLKLAALDTLGPVDEAQGQLAWLGAVDEALRFSPHADELRDDKGQMRTPIDARRRLAQLPLAGSALWVLDNVPVLTPEPLRDALLAFWRAPMADARTLITTRDGSAIDGFTAVPLDVMADDDALRLLAGYRRPVDAAETDAALAVVASTGAHTQALVLLGAHLRDSPGGYRQLLQEVETLGAVPRIEQVAANLQHSLGARARGVLAAYAISLRALDADARMLLGLAALCESNVPFPAALLCDAADVDGDAGTRALSSLYRSALLTRRKLADDPSTVPLVEMHPITAQACLSLLASGGSPDTGITDGRFVEAARPALRQKLARQLLDALAEAHDIRTHPRSAPYLAQARFFARTLNDAVAVQIGLRTGRFSEAAGVYAQARRDYESSLSLARTVLGEEHPDTLTSMNNLAGTLWAMGELAAAREMEKQVLAISRRVLGEEHPDTLTSMNNLAATLRAMGELTAARAMHEQELAICRRVLGEEHPDTLTSMSNLAGTLWAMGELAAARAMQERVLAIRRRVLGEEHPGTLTGMNNLAATLRAMGELAAARAMQEQVLEIRRRVLGEEHPDTLTSMNNLALTLRAMGELAAARAMQEQVLAIRRRVLGEEHPDTLTSMNNLAGTLRAMGELAAARAMQVQVLAMRRRVLGEEHPDTLTSMNNLAGTLRAMGELAAAWAMHEQELAICRRVLGEEHPDTLTSMNNLAGTLRAMGELAAAREMEKQVLAISRRVQGEEHPDTLTSMNNLAHTLWAMGELAAARAMQEQVLAISRRVLGEEHPNTLARMKNLASMQPMQIDAETSTVGRPDLTPPI